MPEAEKTTGVFSRIVPVLHVLIALAITLLSGSLGYFVTKRPIFKPIEKVEPIDFDKLEEEISKNLRITVSKQEQKINELRKDLELRAEDLDKRSTELMTIVKRLDDLSEEEKKSFQFVRLSKGINNIRREIKQLSNEWSKIVASFNNLEKKVENDHSFLEGLKGEILSNPIKILRVRNLSNDISNISERLGDINTKLSNIESRSNTDYRFLITLVSGLFGGGITLTIFLLRRLRDVEDAAHRGQPTGQPPEGTD